MLPDISQLINIHRNYFSRHNPEVLPQYSAIRLSNDVNIFHICVRYEHMRGPGIRIVKVLFGN